MELNIKDFDELEQYFKRKQQHTEELEHLNTELTIENRKLQQEVFKLKSDRVRLINELIHKKTPPAFTDDVPNIFRGRK